MYLKSIGCVLILFSSVFLGYSFKLQTQRTLSAYENLLLCMQMFERDIRHSLNDILTITSQVAGIATDANLLLFKTFLSKAEAADGKPLSAIWCDAVCECSGKWCYDKEDADIFLEFGSILGSGDVGTQIKNINKFCDKVNERTNHLKNKKLKSDEVFAKLGIYMGVLLIIFLI